MSGQKRGQAIAVIVSLANWRQEGPAGRGKTAAASMDGTSRVTGDVCERLGVKFPGPNQQ